MSNQERRDRRNYLRAALRARNAEVARLLAQREANLSSVDHHALLDGIGGDSSRLSEMT